MFRRFCFLAALSFSLFSAQAAPGLSVYLHGQLFTGSVLTIGHEIYLETDAFLAAVDLPQGYPLPKNSLLKVSGRNYISMMGAAKHFHALVNINWSTGIADFYTLQAGGAFASGPILIMSSAIEEKKPPGDSMAYAGNSGYVPVFPYYLYQPYGIPYPQYLYPAYGIPYPLYSIALPRGVHLSNGVLPEDSQGHWVPIPGFP